MSMSDCPKCWNTPCTCGYMGYSVTRLPGKSQYQADKETARLRRENDALTRRIESLEQRMSDNDGKDWGGYMRHGWEK